MAALWCFCRYVEGGNKAWLIGAGLSCGVSLVFKIVGLYTVAGLLMALALQEAAVASSVTASSAVGSSAVRRAEQGTSRSDGATYAAVLIGGLIVYALIVFMLIRSRLSSADLTHFLLPSLTVGGLVAWRAWSARSADSSLLRAQRLARLMGLFLVGVAVPVLLFSIPFLITGSLGALAEGTLILPFRRLSSAASPPLPLSMALLAPPVIVLVLAAGATHGARRTASLGFLVALLTAVLVFGGRDAPYRWIWATMLLTPTVAVIAGSWAVVRQWRAGRNDPRVTVGAGLVTMLATFTLVQYPWSGPVYFFYVAPLIVLTSLVAVSLGGKNWRVPGLVLLAFAIAFGGRWVGPASLMATAQGRYEVRSDREHLDLDRGRIRVSAGEKAEYEQLATTLRSLAPNGVMYATPDAPEAYFLSGLRNPTRDLYDFFDDQPNRTERIMQILEREDVRVIALNRLPHFSGPPPATLIQALEAEYPNATGIGRFVVRWK